MILVDRSVLIDFLRGSKTEGQPETPGYPGTKDTLRNNLLYLARGASRGRFGERIFPSQTLFVFTTFLSPERPCRFFRGSCETLHGMP
jgi:hypothetical protein